MTHHVSEDVVDGPRWLARLSPATTQVVEVICEEAGQGARALLHGDDGRWELGVERTQ